MRQRCGGRRELRSWRTLCRVDVSWSRYSSKYEMKARPRTPEIDSLRFSVHQSRSRLPLEFVNFEFAHMVCIHKFSFFRPWTSHDFFILWLWAFLPLCRQHIPEPWLCIYLPAPRSKWLEEFLWRRSRGWNRQGRTGGRQQRYVEAPTCHRWILVAVEIKYRPSGVFRWSGIFVVWQCNWENSFKIGVCVIISWVRTFRRSTPRQLSVITTRTQHFSETAVTFICFAVSKKHQFTACLTLRSRYLGMCVSGCMLQVVCQIYMQMTLCKKWFKYQRHESCKHYCYFPWLVAIHCNEALRVLIKHTAICQQ